MKASLANGGIGDYVLITLWYLKLIVITNEIGSINQNTILPTELTPYRTLFS